MKKRYSFKKIYIDYIDYKKNKGFKQEKESLSFKIGFDLKKDENFKSKTATILLFVKIFEPSPKYPFFLEIGISGTFKANKDFTKKDFRDMCDIGAPMILFPYMRTIISTITSQCGYPTLTIPMITTPELLKSPKKKKTASKKKKSTKK